MFVVVTARLVESPVYKNAAVKCFDEHILIHFSVAAMMACEWRAQSKMQQQKEGLVTKPILLLGFCFE